MKPCCPVCGVVLVPIEETDSWRENPYVKGSDWVGHCLECHKNYKYSVSYAISRIYNFEEVEDKENDY